MKKTILLLTVFTIALNTFSQKLIKRDTIFPNKQSQSNSNEIRTLFNSDRSFGGYFAMSLGYTNLGTKDACVAGGRFIFVANHYLGIGFGGKGIISNSSNIPNTTLMDSYTYSNYAGGYGGIYIEPIILSTNPVHIAVPLLFGGGAFQCIQWTKNFDETNPMHTSVFMVFEPGIDIEFNIAKWFRIGIGASYTLSSKMDENDYYESDILRGLNYGLTFKVGKF